MSNPQSTFPFLDLPAELRNEIYKLFFSGCTIRPHQGPQPFFCCIKHWHKRPVSCQHRKSNTNDQWSLFTHMIALSRTCRQIYGETRLLPFRYCSYDTSIAYNSEPRTWLLWLTRMDRAMFEIVWEGLTEEQRAFLLWQRDTRAQEHWAKHGLPE